MQKQISIQEKEKLKKIVMEKFKNCNLDFQQFDFESEIDNQISFQENFESINSKLNSILPTEKMKTKRKEAEIISKEQEEFLVNKEIEKIEKNTELEFQKTIQKIANSKTTEIINEIFFIPKNFIKMVANKNAKGFIFYGEAGTGKSYLTMKTFRECKKSFVYLSGHITPLELYVFLFKNKNENIILDDVNILNSEINLNMIKSALNDNSRIVCYHTSSGKLKIPNRFIFEGTITLLLNQKPKQDENLRAVESRVLNYELKLSYSDKIKILKELSLQNYKNLSQEERNNIFDWIKENTDKATENLSLRTLFFIYEIYLFDKINWKKISQSFIKKNSEIEMILQNCSSVEFCETTGKSRATFFRLKRKLLD